ncbi:MAG TPA: 2-amino-4-hydroxy-6-hydroxymethyldihydropteridine diphosphokinase [Bacteroidales bacterium]|nr:2-amino-4-hydroxy-6-hydroxymethyldihydropteridine diphosphokinase [Bacteroidales bacterium]
MKEVYILLGSNRGEREGMILRALEMIHAQAGRVVRLSGLYETAPWGFNDPVAFLNQVAEIDTDLGPEELLESLLTIETRLGRIRPPEGCGCGIGGEAAYESRTIDLDILFYGNRMVFTDKLMIPHPRLHERRFTLVPLNDLAPDFVHPLLKASISSLLKRCTDPSAVTVCTGPTG